MVLKIFFKIRKQNTIIVNSSEVTVLKGDINK